ncbi:MAG TPA: hypothetical protein PLP07_06165 [Pyrinomonadaceae bacterium]|mgnify:CR=1 FL=1|nr:hypothetical protein [Chloracidobacterium sp.]MBP9936343.1 hypothetical protein [Pyrinomonadaceae bacterium]MBK7802983.1 hypothetical protein [Chloracidobacterium sp.]MBL0240747.1 hypothetical protein [Chloracidobacterium sp.]HQX55492.1 hypothetical protein [Pyrinomonadaceae bacterium]
MGDLADEVFKPISWTICKDPRLAGHAICGPVSNSAKKTLEMLEGELDELDNSLSVVEFATEFGPYADKVRALRGKIGVIKNAISTPLAYASLYDDSYKLVNDIRRIRNFDPRTDPVGAAKAYGTAMQSLGKLVEKLPPPANAVGSLIAEMGKIFAKVVGDIVPSTRPTNVRVQERARQGGDFVDI